MCASPHLVWFLETQPTSFCKSTPSHLLLKMRRKTCLVRWGTCLQHIVWFPNPLSKSEGPLSTTPNSPPDHPSDAEDLLVVEQTSFLRDPHRQPGQAHHHHDPEQQEDDNSNQARASSVAALSLPMPTSISTKLVLSCSKKRPHTC